MEPCKVKEISVKFKEKVENNIYPKLYNFFSEIVCNLYILLMLILGKKFFLK